MITLPKDKGPNHGLHRNRYGVYQVRWTVDGKQRTRTTGTKNAKEARAMRDRIYERLELEKGAVRIGSTDHAVDADRYIYQRPPYVVKVPGQKIYACENANEARKVRNYLLGVENDKALPQVGLE